MEEEELTELTEDNSIVQVNVANHARGDDLAKSIAKSLKSNSAIFKIAEGGWNLSGNNNISNSGWMSIAGERTGKTALFK